MRKTIAAIMLFFVLTLAGCASQQTVNALQQSAGVLSAIATLPPVPADAKTQAQVAGWQAWAAYLAPLVESVGVGIARAAIVGGL